MNRILKNLRIAHDFSLKDLAEKLNVSPSFVSQIERGVKKPNDQMLEKYSKVFCVSKEALKSFEQKEKDSINMSNVSLLYYMLDKIIKMRGEL